MGRKLTESMKKHIAAKQNYRCANEPGKKLERLENYQCLLWKLDGINRGIFDQSGYQIDHIVEYSQTHDDSENNLQALCPNCHSFKKQEIL